MCIVTSDQYIAMCGALNLGLGINFWSKEPLLTLGSQSWSRGASEGLEEVGRQLRDAGCRIVGHICDVGNTESITEAHRG